ncbi:hypothetical protein HZ326_19796 [Fusarium oxysporum f. sp. albedinis]|nr:hypothetical protein HZ326_19796 [Fusarium oxysporum f. sp. albedinis]
MILSTRHLVHDAAPMSGAVPNSRNPGCTVQKSISDNLPFLEFGSGTLAGPQSTKNSRAQGNPRAVRSSIQHTPPWLERRDPNQNTLIPASTTPFPFSGTSLCQFTGVFKLITTSLGSSFTSFCLSALHGFGTSARLQRVIDNWESINQPTNCFIAHAGIISASLWLRPWVFHYQPVHIFSTI